MRRITPYLVAGVQPALNTTSARNQGQMTASDTWVVKPTLVNSLTFGYQTDLRHAGEEELGFEPPLRNERKP
jgi:hypothetical protein